MKKDTAKNLYETILVVVALTLGMLLAATLVDGIFKTCHADDAVHVAAMDYMAVEDILLNMTTLPNKERFQVAINYMTNIMKTKRRVAYLKMVANAQGTDVGGAIANLAKYVYHNLL